MTKKQQIAKLVKSFAVEFSHYYELLNKPFDDEEKVNWRVKFNEEKSTWVRSRILKMQEELKDLGIDVDLIA